MNELALLERDTLTVKEVKAQVNLIQKVLESVMKADVHYGVIPGCKKPSLYKPGAEKIMTTFRLAADPTSEDLSVDDEIRYRANVKITSHDGTFLGAGVGECSSNEGKYRWEKAVCIEEWNETPEDRRREKWYRGKGNNKNYQVKQIRTNIADQANTILKMAKKRALVDAVLTVTAASDIFDQDLEDLSEELRNGHKTTNGKPDVKPPQSKSGKSTKDTNGDTELREKLRKFILDMCGDTPENANDLLEEYTKFTGDDEKEHSVRNLDKLKGAWLLSTYGKAKKAWEEAGFGVRPEDMEDGGHNGQE